MTSRAVVGIDIGTSSSGFAFSAGGSDHILTSNAHGVKIPTILLLKLPSLEFVAFGPEAKQIFDEATPQQRNDYLYFANFKMALYEKKDNHDNKEEKIKIKAKNNQIVGVDAEIIFQHCIGFLVERALFELNKFGTAKWSAQTVLWVLTVPSIWDLSAKDTMKKAAIKAKIPESQLAFAVESEAAAISCRHLCQNKNDKDDKATKHQTFLVIDLGGGTADFTVHRMVNAKHTDVVEVVAPSGGPWGGATVNERFYQLLRQLFGERLMETFQYQSPHAFLELEQSFELLKTRAAKLSAGNASACVVRLPTELIQLIPKLKTDTEIELSWFVHEVQNEESQRIVTIDDYVPSTQEKEKESKESALNDDGDEDDKDKWEDVEPEEMSRFLAEHKTEIWFHQGKLKFTWHRMLSFFSDVVKGIEEHTHTILKAHPEIDTAFLVGGFSQSTIVRNHLIEHVFNEKQPVRLALPSDPQQAVLFGAVMYGNRPRQIRSRIAQRNYGICGTINITAKNHELFKKEFKDVPRRLAQRNGRIQKCLEDIYQPLCKIGDVLPIATEADFTGIVKDPRVWHAVQLRPESKTQKSLMIEIYEATKPERQWISPDSLKKKLFVLVGCVRITLENHHIDQKLTCWFYFGDHEIKTCVVNESSGKIVQSTVIINPAT